MPTILVMCKNYDFVMAAMGMDTVCGFGFVKTMN